MDIVATAANGQGSNGPGSTIYADESVLLAGEMGFSQLSSESGGSFFKYFCQMKLNSH